jgi:hypothetical protein
MTTPEPVQPLVVDELDDEICLFRPDVDEVLVLNATAADIWRLLDGRTSTDEIAGLLATAYGADPGTVLADVRAVVADLAARGFVVAHSAAAARS